MKSWKKAVRRLVDAYLTSLWAKYPEHYRLLTRAELQEYVRKIWLEVQHKLKRCPVRIYCHDCQTVKRQYRVWSMVGKVYFE